MSKMDPRDGSPQELVGVKGKAKNALKRNTLASLDYLRQAENELKRGKEAASAEIKPYAALERYNPLYEYLSTGIRTDAVDELLGGQDINQWISDTPAAKYQRMMGDRALGARGMYNTAAGLSQQRDIEAANWNDYFNRLGGIYTTGKEANYTLADYEQNLASGLANQKNNMANLYSGYGNSLSNIEMQMGAQIAAAKAAEKARIRQVFANASGLNALSSYLGDKSTGAINMGGQPSQPAPNPTPQPPNSPPRSPQGGGGGYGGGEYMGPMSRTNNNSGSWNEFIGGGSGFGSGYGGLTGGTGAGLNSFASGGSFMGGMGLFNTFKGGMPGGR